MSLIIRKSDSAVTDVAHIWNYIAFEVPSSADPIAADKVVSAIEQTFQTLADFPHRKETHRKGIFLCPVEGYPQYVILYQFDDETLEILSVLRASLDWTRLL